MILAKIKWEMIEHSNARHVERAKVPNGWLVTINKSSCYIPDKDHGWLKKHTNNKDLIDDKKLIEKLFIPIENLGLSVRAKKVLKKANILFVGDLVCDKEMLNDGSFNKIKLQPKLGQKSYKEIITTLNLLGFDKPIKCDEYHELRIEK